MADKEAKIVINSNEKAAIFFGNGDENFKYIKELSEAELSARGSQIIIRGSDEEVKLAFDLVQNLLHIVESEANLNNNDFN